MEDSGDSSFLDTTLANTTFERAILTRRTVNYEEALRQSTERENTCSIQEDSKSAESNTVLWLFVAIISIVAAGNLSLTFCAMGVLHLGAGMESIEFFPSMKGIKFFGLTDLGNIMKMDGIISGFADVPFSIVGDNSQVSFSLRTRFPSSELEIGPDAIEIRNIKEFKVTENHSDRDVFSTKYPNFELPSNVRNLGVRKALTSRIISSTFSSLDLKSESTIRLKGNEGLSFKGKDIKFTAEKDIYLKSLNGSVSVKSLEGIYVVVGSLPFVGGNGIEEGRGQYKLCICLPDGQLYKVPVPADNNKRSKERKITCSSFSNPCKKVI